MPHSTALRCASCLHPRSSHPLPHPARSTVPTIYCIFTLTIYCLFMFWQVHARAHGLCARGGRHQPDWRAAVLAGEPARRAQGAPAASLLPLCPSSSLLAGGGAPPPAPRATAFVWFSPLAAQPRGVQSAPALAPPPPPPSLQPSLPPQPGPAAARACVPQVCDKYGCLLVMDASLLSDNLYFIKQREQVPLLAFCLSCSGPRPQLWPQL